MPHTQHRNPSHVAMCMTRPYYLRLKRERATTLAFAIRGFSILLLQALGFSPLAGSSEAQIGTGRYIKAMWRPRVLCLAHPDRRAKARQNKVGKTQNNLGKCKHRLIQRTKTSLHSPCPMCSNGTAQMWAMPASRASNRHNQRKEPRCDVRTGQCYLGGHPFQSGTGAYLGIISLNP